MILATSFAVNGIHGVLVLLAVLAFLVAAVVAFFVSPVHRWAIALIAGGLCLATLALLVT